MNPTVGLPAFLYPLSLHPDVKAFSTLRAGGVSKGEYGSFNVCHYTGDNMADVQANRTRLAEYLGVSPERIVLPRQTHSVEVRFLEDVPAPGTLDGVDAVITNQSRLCIGVSTADCIPILLYDSKNHIVAAVHAGWRGTVGRILERTLQQMQTLFGTLSSELFAAIGPGIGLDAYEVGDELPQQFAAAGFPMQWIARRIGKRWHLDLPEANRQELLRLGIPRNQIHSCGLCTYANNARFFSARRQGIGSGRIYTAVMMP